MVTEKQLQPATNEPKTTASGARKRSRRFLTFLRDLWLVRGVRWGVIFGVGLLIGWLIIGWWLWPTRRANAQPWHLAPAYQRAYVNLVATDYGHTQDALNARKALAGWDAESLNALLIEMRLEARTVEARRRLDRLAQLVALPDPEPTLGNVFWEHRVLWITTLVAALPFAAAVGFALSPWGRNRPRSSSSVLGEGVAEIEADWDRLLNEVDRSATDW